MSHTNVLKYRLSLAAIVFCAVGIQTAVASTVSLVPGASSVAVGDSVSLDLAISGLVGGAAPSLGGYDITVEFPSIFTLNSEVFGDPILGDQLQLVSSGFTEANVGSGSVELIEVSFDTVATLNTLQPDAFTLAVLNFTANSAGSGNFSLANITLSDASGKVVGSSISNATIAAVSSVPEPATLLPLCGLLALIALMRKRISALATRQA